MDLEGLSVICNGLVTPEEDEYGEVISYTKNEYCLDNLKDLQRFLRRDDPQTRDVFKQVCKWNTVSRDLVPIIEHFQDDKILVTSAVKVLVFLTMPIEPTSENISQQIDYLWELKASVTRSDTVAVIVSLLEAPLENLECEAFSEDDWKLVQLVLTLFRNILAIQDISVHQKASGHATQYMSVRDRFLELLFSENVMDLILALTQHVGGSHGYLRQDNLLFLEIFHYIFSGQEPDLIVKASQKVTKADEDVESSVNSLRSLMDEEKDKRRLARLHVLDRHSQFSGAFTRIAVDGSKSLLMGNPAISSRERMLKPHTVHRGPIKRIVGDCGRLTSSSERILEQLYDFINQFLSGGYNELMQSVRKDIEKEHPAIQNNDIIVFFQVAQFVTGFQRQKFLLLKKPNVETDAPHIFSNNSADNTLFQGDICGPIASTMNEAMFLLVISKWRNAFEGLKETNDYKSLSAAASLMKNMIRMLDLVLRLLPDDSKEPQTVRILLYKLFYDQTDQGLTQFLLMQIKSFNTHKQSKSDLADLVEMIHVVVRLMEKLQARGTLRVARKAKKGRKKKVLDNTNTSVDERLGDNPVNINTDAGDHPINSHNDVDKDPISPHDNVSDFDSKHPKDSSIGQEEQCGIAGSDRKLESFSLSNQIDERGIPPTDTREAGDDLSRVSKELFQNSGSDGKVDSYASNHIDELGIRPTDTGDASDDLNMASKELFENSGIDGKVKDFSATNQIDELGIPLSETVGAVDDSTPTTNNSSSNKPGNAPHETDDSFDDDLPADTGDAGDDLNMASKEPFKNSGTDGEVKNFLVTNQIDELGIPLSETVGTVDDSTPTTNKNDSNKPDSVPHETDSSDDDDLPAATNEVDFQVSSFISTFANNTVIQNVCWLLRFYKNNSVSTNHYIICMLRRICDDLELAPMLYQLSLLTTFYDILAEQKSSKCKEHENIVAFLSDLVRRMMRKMKTQPLLFVEILFWKTRRECHYINSESMINELGELKKETRKWESGDKEKVAPSYDIGRTHRSIADALGEDEADVMTSELPYTTTYQEGEDQYSTKRQKVTTVDNADDIDMRASKSDSDVEGEHRNSVDFQNEVSPGKQKRKKRLVFDQELETDITRLYEKFKDEKRCSHNIAHELVEAGKTLTAAQVSRKLKQLGLYVPQKRRLPESIKPSRTADEEALHEKANESDEEPLSVLKKRRKTNTKSKTDTLSHSNEQKKRKSKTDTLSHSNEQKKRKSKKDTLSHSNEHKKKISAEDSDDEVLSSLFVKTGKKRSSRVHVKKPITSSIEGTITGNEPAAQAPDDANRSDGLTHSTELASRHGNANLKEPNLDEGPLSDSITKSTAQSSFGSMDNVDNGGDKEMHDTEGHELEDSEDDVTPVAASKSQVRRKLKMVLDLEDDE